MIMGSLWVSSPLVVFFCHEGKILIVRQCNHIIWFNFTLSRVWSLTILCFSSYLFIAYSILQCYYDSQFTVFLIGMWFMLWKLSHVCVLIANPWIGNFVLSLVNCMRKMQIKMCIWLFSIVSRTILLFNMKIDNYVILQYCLEKF